MDEGVSVARSRPYRFGIAWGLVNLVGGVYYAWSAVEALSERGMAAPLGFAVNSFSALLALGTGVGLLLKKTYGMVLLGLSILMATIEVISSWFRPDHLPMAYLVFGSVVFFAATAAIVLYFDKRKSEFQ